MRDLLNIGPSSYCRVCGAAILQHESGPWCKRCESQRQDALSSVSQMPWVFVQLELDMCQVPEPPDSSCRYFPGIALDSQPHGESTVCRACKRGIESLAYPGTCHSCGVNFPADSEALAAWLALPERRARCRDCRYQSLSRMPDGRLKCFRCDSDQDVSDPYIGNPPSVLFGQVVPRQSRPGNSSLEHQGDKKPGGEALEHAIEREHGQVMGLQTEVAQDAETDEPGGRQIAVFRQDQLNAADASIQTQIGDADHNARIKATMCKLFQAGCYRPLATPGADWQAKIEALALEFPNFSQAIAEVILPSLAIAAAGGIARAAPLLLVGPPGVGKSYFAQRLARMLQVPQYHVDMASASMGATLGGLGVHWSTSGPGVVFKSLAFGQDWQGAVANPIIFLDEIDKVSPDQRYDPLAPLYALLETQTARRFQDESLPGISMDASCIRWVLCANDTAPIPRPILSRVHVVHVPEPAPRDRRAIFERIFARVVSETGLDEFDKTAPDPVFALADSMGPREFGKRSAMAVGRALAGNRRKVTADDFFVIVSVAPDRRIGFV